MSVCGLADLAFGKVVSYFQRMEFLNSINIFDIGDNYVALDMAKRFKLYGVMLESDSNREFLHTSFEDMAKEVKHFGEGEIFVCFVSKKNYKSVFVLGYSDKIIGRIASDYSTKKLTGEQIASAIYDFYHTNDFIINDKNQQVSTEDFSNFFVPNQVELISGRFKARVQNASSNNLEQGTVYQGVSFTGKKNFSVTELFKIEWVGTLAIRIDFKNSAVNNLLKKYQDVAKKSDKNFARICDDIISNKDKELAEDISRYVCTANAFLFLKDEYRNQSAAIGNETGINFAENTLTGPAIMSKSLFLLRDFDFDTLVEVSVVKKFLSSSKKKPVAKNKMAYFWGLDISDNFVNYNFRDASTSPHTIVIGRNGSGKSRQVIKMIEIMLGLNADKTEVLRLGEIKIRYADVGFTSGRLLQALKRISPLQVNATEANIDDLRFSLFDLDVSGGRVITAELDYLVGIINFAIQTKNGEILNGVEEDFFRKVVTKMLLNKSYTNHSLNILQDKGGYGFLLRELLENGYTLDTQFSELSSEYDFLRKPVLSEVLNAIGVQRESTSNSNLDRQSLESLELKLKMLSSYYFLDFHSNSKEMTDYDFFHIDFDSLKDTPASFCVIYWLIMKKWIKMLKQSAKRKLVKNEEPIDTFFVIEEAHNFFSYPIFSKMLTTASKELRKYGGKLIFITQQLEDIPEEIAKEIGTKIFVAPPSEKAMLKDDIIKVFKHLDTRDEYVLSKTTDYMMFIMYDTGSIGCKFQYEGDCDWFYKPYALSF